MKLRGLFAVAVMALSAMGFADEAVDSAGLSEVATEAGETHEFQAEVDRLMDIIINSLYTNKDIFLRELISNAADASDKIRFEALKDVNLLGEGDLAELDIKIEVDEAARTITLTDKGIGMTKEELVKNLGTVAKSGTSEFLNAASADQKGALDLIGQFGVGFYSVYLVADKVTVVSKNNNDKQYIWESTANSVFSVAEDPRGDTLGRGTSITLHLKEDAEEFLKPQRLKDIVGRYSQFVTVPIFLKEEKTVTRTVPVEKEEKEEAEQTEETEEGDLEVTEEEEEEEEEETEEIQEQVVEWTRVNTAKAIWTRPPKEVNEEDYEQFFHALTNDRFPDGSLDHVHFEAEGEISFKSLLYIPKEADRDAYSDLFSIKKSGVHLYVRRVLISDQFEDFLPRYMNFVRGVVDSDDLPLQVSRENLSESRVLKVMSKKLIRKVLDMLRKMAEAGEEQDPEDLEEGEEPREPTEDYKKFWEVHGKAIKFGVIDDHKNKAKLSKLLRFPTSRSEGEDVSLASYVNRMPDDQKYVYYITGETMEKVQGSPFLEKLLAKGYEVIYMVDPLDEYVVSTLSEFDGVELMSVTKDNLKLGDEDRAGLATLKENFKPLTDWLKETYKGQVGKVVVSNRLGQSPCILVTSQHGWSANMQRIVRGSTLQGSGAQNAYMTGSKTLEINAHHPIMQALLEKVEAEDTEGVEDLALVMLDAAMVTSGFTIDNVASYNQRMARVLATSLEIDPAAAVDEEVEDPSEEEEESDDDEEDDEEEEEELEDDEEEEPPKAHEEL